MMSDDSKQENNDRPHFNSVQLNLVAYVDVRKANAHKSLDDAFYMMDNGVGSQGQGTADLQTICKQGQTLNWIIYAMDMNKRLDGTWPPSVRISNIVFLDKDGENVASTPVCSAFKIFGSPDKVRSPNTPVYYYWAGTVLSDLPPGIYPYRFILELDQEDSGSKRYLNTPGQLSLNVIDVNG